MAMAMANEGREGDWDCSGCRNRNYAFRSFCNRCKQPRLLVDTKTPKDSKWLPRIGDWICTGCSNNNYASRKNCKKCSKSKEEAAMPAIAMPGMSLPTYAHYVARTQGLARLKMNFGMPGNLALQQSLLANPNWSYGGLGRYGLHSSPSWPFTGSNTSGISYASNTNQFSIVPKDWREGDWICTCGFHNYSSRSQCKECNASVASDAPSATMKTTVSDIFPTLGTKRLASEEFVNDWDSKRLNAGHMNRQFSTNDQHHLFEGFEEDARCSDDQAPEMYSKYANGNLAALSSGQVNAQSPQIAGMPALLGKGSRIGMQDTLGELVRAKQWREGDWMCSNCNNHNFASRTYCNRCKTQKEAAVRPVGAL